MTIPANIAQDPFRRVATRDVIMSDGTKIPKGAFVTVTGRNKDPSIFPEPDKFDFRRFLAQPGQETDRTKYIGQSPEMIQFGYGKHSCAGKHIAVTEIKIALGHFLLMYDWKMDPSLEYISFKGGIRVGSRTAQLQVRKRDIANEEL